MLRISSIIFTLLLFGCATHVVSSSPHTVVVESEQLNGGEAQKLADQECGKVNKHARMIKAGNYWERNYVFDCL